MYIQNVMIEHASLQVATTEIFTHLVKNMHTM